MNDAQTGNITGHNTIASALTNIVTGKEDANFHHQIGNIISLLAQVIH